MTVIIARQSGANPAVNMTRRPASLVTPGVMRIQRAMIQVTSAVAAIRPPNVTGAGSEPAAAPGTSSGAPDLLSTQSP